MDRIRDGALAATYLATEEDGAVALVRLEPQSAPEAIAFLERLDGASHLFTELQNERVYSLKRFFAAEYSLSESGTATMELPVYPEAMIAGASRGGERDRVPEQPARALPEARGAAANPSADEAAVPTATWRFVRSEELLYMFPGESAEIYVVRLVR